LAAHEKMVGKRNEEVQRALDASPTKKSWVFAHLASGKVNCLNADGQTVDLASFQNAFFLEYPAGAKSVGAKTWWGYEHGKGPVYTSGSNQTDEGVYNFQKMTDDIASKDFELLQIEGDVSATQIKEAVRTNTLLLTSPEHLPKTLDFARVKEVSENLLKSLPPNGAWAGAEWPLVIAIARTSHNEEVAIVYSTYASQKSRKLIAVLRTLSTNPADSKQFLESTMAGYKGKRVYVYGDLSQSVDFRKLASDAGAELVVRPFSTTKSFRTTELRLETLNARHLSPNRMVVANGIPHTKKELEFMGAPDSSLDGWRKIRGQIETNLKGSWSRRIESRADLINELQTGDSDVLFLVAHSDGVDLFIGGEKVSLAELAALPVRKGAPSSPRVAVLVSCYAGSLGPKPETFIERVTRMLRSREAKQSLAEILLNKHFFDQVLAPEGEINADQGVALVDQTLKELRKSLGASVQGLWRIAEELFVHQGIAG
jgi:hypothetical protein